MGHLTKFETLNDFQEVQSILDLPNVCLITSTMEINYLPYGQLIPEHEIEPSQQHD